MAKSFCRYIVTDVGESYPSRDYFKSQICLLLGLFIRKIELLSEYTIIIVQKFKCVQGQKPTAKIFIP